MAIKSDKWIEKMALKHQMINPFVSEQIRKDNISYGLSSFGYDIRISNEYKIFTNVNNSIVDPKNFDSNSFIDFSGDICILRCPIILGKRRFYRFGILFGLIKDNHNIPLIGKCENKLSFVHVIDVCRAIDSFFNCTGKHIFNIAADEHEEFQFILKRLIKKVNSKTKLIHFNKVIGNFMFDLVTFFRLVPWTSYHKKYLTTQFYLIQKPVLQDHQ